MTSTNAGMRRPIGHLVLLLLFVLFIAATGMVSRSGHRIQDEANEDGERVKLERTPLAPKKARGSMVVNVGATDEDITRIKYKGSVRSLAQGRFIYRIWLWDGFDDVKIPLTKFRVDGDGPTRFSGVRRIQNIERFDQVVVTRQRTRGSEVERDPRIMLVGEIAVLAN